METKYRSRRGCRAPTCVTLPVPSRRWAGLLLPPVFAAAGDVVSSSSGPFVIQSVQNTTHCFAVSHVSPVGCGMNLAACQARPAPSAGAAAPSGKPPLVCGYAIDLVQCDIAAPAEKLFSIVNGTLFNYGIGFYLNFLQARTVRATDTRRD